AEYEEIASFGAAKAVSPEKGWAWATSGFIKSFAKGGINALYHAQQIDEHRSLVVFRSTRRKLPVDSRPRATSRAAPTTAGRWSSTCPRASRSARPGSTSRTARW